MDHEVKRWPGLSWNNCTLKKTEANDWLCLVHTHTQSHRSVHKKTQSILLLLCHNETSVGRVCYNFIVRQQLSVLYSSLSRHYTECHLLWVIGEKNAYYDLVKSSLAAQVWFVEAGLFFGMMKLQSRKPEKFQRRFARQMVRCSVGERGWEFATCLCSQC